MTSSRTWRTGFRTRDMLSISAQVKAETPSSWHLAGWMSSPSTRVRSGCRRGTRHARERGLTLRTQAVDLQDFDAEQNSFDVIRSIFVHLPETLRAAVHKRVGAWLKPGGVFLLEAYAPDQIERDTGGPKDPSLLASLEVIPGELDGLEIEHQAALVRDVSEGGFHTGEASVAQVLARKRSSGSSPPLA
jgi:SAM-dependent methyltransferase